MAIPEDILAKIEKHAVSNTMARNDVPHEEVNVWVHTEEVPKAAALTVGLNKSYNMARPTVLALVDLKPRYNWGHPCEHHLYDAKTGDLYDVKKAQLPPIDFFINQQQFRLVHGTLPMHDRAMPGLPQRIPQLDNALTNAGGQRYAILFSGMSNNRHLNDLEFLYRTLLDIYHFDPANIISLNYDGTLNYAGDPTPVTNWPGDNTPYRIKINGPGTNVALAQAMDNIGGRIKADDLLLIHTNNHGSGQPYDPEAWICCYPNLASYTATGFGAKLRTLPPIKSLVVMMEQCHSGGFRDVVIENSRAATTSFASACTFDSSSIGGADFDPFARDWIAGITGHNPNGTPLSQVVPVPASASDAYNYATAVKDPYDSPVFLDKPVACGKSQYLTGSLSLSLASSVATLNADGRLEVLLIGTDQSVWNMWQQAPHSAPWSTVNNLAGKVKQLTSALNSDGRLEIFGVGTDNAAYNAYQKTPHEEAWSGWNRLGGVVKQLAAACNSDGRLELFGIGSDNAVYNMWQPAPHSGPWSNWNRLGGNVKQISVAVNTDGRMELYGIGTDDALYHIWQNNPHDSKSWSSWNRLGGTVKEIAAMVNKDGRQEVFAIGSDNALRHIYQTAPHSAPWSNWSSLGGNISEISAIRNSDGRIEIYGVGSDHALWHIIQDPAKSSGWGAWSSLGGNVHEISATVNSDGRAEVFGIGTDNGLYHIYQTAPAGGWSSWSKMV